MCAVGWPMGGRGGEEAKDDQRVEWSWRGGGSRDGESVRAGMRCAVLGWSSYGEALTDWRFLVRALHSGVASATGRVGYDRAELVLVQMEVYANSIALLSRPRRTTQRTERADEGRRKRRVSRRWGEQRTATEGVGTAMASE